MKPVVELLRSGFVPILHGDCVLDDVQGCAILSGDKIIEVNDSFISVSVNFKHAFPKAFVRQFYFFFSQVQIAWWGHPFVQKPR